MKSPTSDLRHLAAGAAEGMKVAGLAKGDDLSKETEQQLQHELGNARAETEALKSMLGKAADRLEEIVEADCSDEEQAKAIKTAKRLRVAIERTGSESQPRV